MTIQEIANRLVELARQGKIDQIIEELHAPNAVAIEADDSMGPKVVEGVANIKAKNDYFNASIETFHGATISDPVVSSKYFSVAWSIDVTMKGGIRNPMDEIVVYKVEDGKIVSEQFFY